MIMNGGKRQEKKGGGGKIYRAQKADACLVFPVSELKPYKKKKKRKKETG